LLDFFGRLPIIGSWVLVDGSWAIFQKNEPSPVATEQMKTLFLFRVGALAVGAIST
jgi:hypothetical protein